MDYTLQAIFNWYFFISNSEPVYDSIAEQFAFPYLVNFPSIYFYHSTELNSLTV